MIYVVAGGPSLKDFDWSLLYDKKCIAVNRGFEKVPNAIAVYFSDMRIWHWYGSQLKQHGAKLYTGSKIADGALTSCKLTGMKGLDTTAYNLRHGNNSGYAAINLAYHLIEQEKNPDRRIVLLGFDMTFIDGQSNWHDGYAVKTEPSVYTKMLGNFDLLAKELTSHGYYISNANLDSKIECFVKMPLSRLLYEGV